MTAVSPSSEQTLRAALLWAGDAAAAAGRSAAELYGLEGVRAEVAEIALPPNVRGKTAHVVVHHGERPALMVRQVSGLPATGVECTLVQLAATLESEAFEVACEDARRRRLTSVPALAAYLQRFGRRGRPGVGTVRDLLRQLDPGHPARSTLEVKTRRLLLTNGFTGFAREFALEWNGRTYLYDFAFERQRTILETNGRRWHDDPADYERDNDKWSVPGRLGYRIVFATWNKVTREPEHLLHELATTLSPRGCGGRRARSR
jgi:very-short-patch-repair endonuclease